jgi:hypothetical protein
LEQILVKMPRHNKQELQKQRAEKRAAALRENLKKRKAKQSELVKNTKETRDDTDSGK